MVDIKRYGTAGGTVLAAAAIGFFMQNSDATASRIGQDASNGEVSFAATTQPVQAGVIVPTPVAPVAPSVSSASSDASVEAKPILVAAPSEVVVPDADKAPVTATACDVSMSASVTAAAMVDLQLNAPCAKNERVTVHHEGMMFNITTDASGQALVSVPALAENAVFIAAFANEEGAVATATVDTVGLYDRVVLQWRGEAGVQIHAREFGADYGDAGHVWAGAARDVGAVSTGTGGFLTTLGSADLGDPLMAEIYTFPTSLSKVSADVVLSVEAEVTAKNCGKDIAAQSLQMDAKGERKALDLEIAMPACDAVGDFLVLKEMFSDIRVAQN